MLYVVPSPFLGVRCSLQDAGNGWFRTVLGGRMHVSQFNALKVEMFLRQSSARPRPALPFSHRYHVPLRRLHHHDFPASARPCLQYMLVTRYIITLQPLRGPCKEWGAKVAGLIRCDNETDLGTCFVREGQVSAEIVIDVAGDEDCRTHAFGIW